MTFGSDGTNCSSVKPGLAAPGFSSSKRNLVFQSAPKLLRVYSKLVALFLLLVFDWYSGVGCSKFFSIFETEPNECLN